MIAIEPEAVVMAGPILAGISAVCAMRLSAGTRYAAVAIRGILAPAQPGHAGGKSLRR